MRSVMRLVGLLVALGLAALGVGLGWAHRMIRRDRPVLPTATNVLAGANDPDLPVAIRWIDTARQPIPRGQMVDPAHDRTPNAPYVMTLPSFVIEWEDGRLMLVDLGMTPEAARRFGKPFERLIGAPAMTVHTTAADRLGDTRRVGAVLFSHLHEDHVEGVQALCDRHQGTTRIPVFLNEGQAERPNYLTRASLGTVRDAWCVREERLTQTSAASVPGFPGIRVAWVAGHTPGSQIVVAHVRGGKGVRAVVFAGDVINVADAVTGDLSKPWLYRTFIVPEDDGRLREVRHLLRALLDAGAVVLPAHDALHIERVGIEPWDAPRP